MGKLESGKSAGLNGWDAKAMLTTAKTDEFLV